MNEDDLRVQRTRQALREAMIALVIEKGYEAVTVRDIARRADVGHKTFYRHYADKETLLYTILGEIVQEFQPVLLPPGAPLAPEQNTLSALRFAHQYANLARALLRSPVAEQLMRPLITFALAEGDRFFGGSDIPNELVSYHFVSGLIYLIRWWLEQGTAYSPEEMAEYVNRLLIRPIVALTANA